jgi:hypothetical protein
MGNFSSHFIIDNTRSDYDLHYVTRDNSGGHWRTDPVEVIPKGETVRQDLNDNGSGGSAGEMVYKYTYDVDVTTYIKFYAADPLIGENTAETYTGNDGKHWSKDDAIDVEYNVDGHPLNATWILKLHG